jgi:4,5-dihydroxyphthalate decarboxylase
MLAQHDTTAALTEGRLDTAPLALEHLTADPIHKVFAPMVREQKYDACELAIVTAIQAVANGNPIIPLPVTVAARLQHKCIVFNAARGTIRPADLAGRRVGVRSYTQTTGAWVRTILEREYRVASSAVNWITTEQAHIEGYHPPANVSLTDSGKSLLQLLKDGDVDAAIFGNDLPKEDWVRPVIPAPDEAARARFAADGIVQINHIVVVAQDFARQHPESVKKLMALLVAAKGTVALAEGEPDLFPVGFEAIRPSIDVLLKSALHQGLITRPMTAQEFFAGSLALL